MNLTVSPRGTVPPSKLIWTVEWETTTLYLSTSSWIGLYPYGEKPTIDNLISNLNLKTLKGKTLIASPSNAGIYDIIYIQDNNLFTIASTGPLIVSPENAYLNFSQHRVNLSEKITFTWDIRGDTLKKLENGKGDSDPIETILCLSPLGSYLYDDCEWSGAIT